MNNLSIKTKAIILKRINYKDSDKLITLYSEKIGKITVLAKGFKNITSRKKSHLELFNLSEIFLVKGRYWHIVTQAETIKPFSNIRGSLQVMYYSFYITEIFNKIIPEEEPNLKLFEFLKATLNSLNDFQDISIVNAFNIKMLMLTGFLNVNDIVVNTPLLKDHLLFLIKSKYELIGNKQISHETSKSAHLYLRFITEEILESEIKTKILF
jgi:DNA repair protein RecO (recombination protein O)